MPISKIQLRGISRVPSDRLVKDGECAESLNVMMGESETVPMAPPIDATEENKPYTLAPGLESSGIDVIYIHKTNAYTNYIGKKVYVENSENVTYLVGYVHHPLGDTWSIEKIRAISYSVNSITSIGNMLVYTLSNGNTYYALCKDESYKDLGSSIPRPTVTFQTEAQTDLSANKVIGVDDVVLFYQSMEGTIPTAKQAWDTIRTYKNESGVIPEEFTKVYDWIYSFVWDTVNKWREENRENNIFSAPLLARYAVKLYDGGYVYLSEPILLSVGKEAYMELKANIGEHSSSYALITMLNTNSQLFKASVSMTYSVSDAWKDLIESVDIFLSTDILCPKLNSGLEYAKELSTANAIISPYSALGNGSHDIRYVDSPDWEMDFEAAMLEKSNFYKVASFPVANMPVSAEYLKCYSQDELVVKDRLEESDPHSIFPNGNLSSYNNRLVSGEQKVVLSPGHSEPQGLLPGTTGSTASYTAYYYVKDANGSTRVVKGYIGTFYVSDVAAYIAYPDANCYKAQILVTSGGNTTINYLDMKEHPRLNVAYGYWGLDNIFGTSEIPQGDIEGWYAVKYSNSLTPTPFPSPSYELSNRLALSEVDNPFVFPVDQRVRFSARIVTAVASTIALSTNQYGQFPIYAFTEDGIWAVSITSSGGLGVPFVVSRDVAIDGTIRQLDEAFIFVSDKGVMLLSGRQVKNLSVEMNGRNYVPNTELISVIQSFSPNSVIVDTVPFLDFVKSSTPAYDYAGNRVIFFSEAHPTFQYVLALANQTWHRIKLPGTTPRCYNVLNSYPDCLVFFGNAGTSLGGKIMDFSTLLDPNSTKDALPGLVVTRDLNLGGNDVYKSIKRLYVRGDRFPEEEPWKYVLLGSNDRKHYNILHSLRGPSWKFFRVAIATTMQQAGRISYIEVDWEPRFTDRIR